MDKLDWMLVAIAGVFIGGLIWGHAVFSRLKGTRDADTSRTVAKHPVLANAIFWSYVIFVGFWLILTYILSIYFNDY